ncbi:MAG: exosortase [Gammaproteobacteria bacterium]|nr:exosortase [Gammaproteobacteria bacterium]
MAIELKSKIQVILNKKLTPLIFILAIPLVISIFNIPILETLWEYGFDSYDYSHGFLIPFIYIFLCYELYQTGSLKMRDGFSLPVSIFFALTCYAFFVSSAAQISMAYWFTNVTLIVSCTLMLFRYHWKIVFPAAYLIFMYPVWGVMKGILQQISVNAVSYLMSFTNVPTYIENQYIAIPAGIFEIAGGCSGLRYLITALAISSLYVFLFIKSTKHTLIFLAFAITGALVTNWLRITIIILVGHHTEMTSDLIHDHNMFGWYLFIPYMFLLFYLGGKLVSYDKDVPDQPILDEKAASGVNILIVSFGVILTSTTIMATGVVQTPQDESSLLNSRELYPLISGYAWETKKEYTYHGSTFLKVTFDFSGKKLSEKPTSTKNQAVNEGWQILHQESDNNWRYIFAAKTGKRALFAFHYSIAGKIETSRVKFKLLRIREAFMGNRSTQLKWIGTICKSDCIQEKAVIMDNKQFLD